MKNDNATVIVKGFPLLTETEGTGYWSRVARPGVMIIRLEVTYVAKDSKFASLNAYFDPTTWDIKDGLIYTDKRWLKTFQAALVSQLDIPQEVADSIGYSEMGMQGDDFVNLDCGAAFYDYIKVSSVIPLLKD